MGGNPTSKGFRRSTRVACTIPVEVSGLDASGQEVYEKTTSNLVNKHGACLTVQHQFSLGSQVVVRVPHTERQQRCRVVWVSGVPRAGGIYQIGVEMEHAENIWGVLSPPEDWGDP